MAALEGYIFGPIVFPLFAAFHLGLAMIALGAWSATPVAALCLALVEFITFFDNAVVGLGNRLGIGDLCRRLNRMRFFLHALFIAGLIPVYAGIGRLAGVTAFDSGLFSGVVAMLTVGIVLVGYFVGYRPLQHIMPADYYGCLRYAQTVNDVSRRAGYDYSQAELEQKAFPPLASILTVLIGLVLSLWIGIAAGFWIPAVVTALMLLAGSFPSNALGALLTSSLEIVYSGGMVYSLVSLAGS